MTAAATKALQLMHIPLRPGSRRRQPDEVSLFSLPHKRRKRLGQEKEIGQRASSRRAKAPCGVSSVAAPRRPAPRRRTRGEAMTTEQQAYDRNVQTALGSFRVVSVAVVISCLPLTNKKRYHQLRLKGRAVRPSQPRMNENESDGSAKEG